MLLGVPRRFLDASSHLYNRVCPSIRPSVRRSVGPLVGWSVMLSSKSIKDRLLQILDDLDSAGRGGGRDEEEGGTGKKAGRGRRRDEESEKMKKLLKK